MMKIEFKKKHSIPQLDFSRIENKRVLKRRNSDSEIISNRSLKRKNIDDVIQKHKETCVLIKEIHDQLDKIKKSNYDESALSSSIKELRNIIDNLDSKDTPRLLSRCDALVGNTRLTVENTHTIISNSKNTLKYLKNIDEEAEQHDIISITILTDILKEINDIKYEISQLNKRIDLLSTRI